MNKELVEIKAMVTPKTKEVIDSITDLTGLSAGEIMDKMVTKASPDNMEEAHLLILENIIISTRRLTQEQADGAVLKALKVLEMACVGEEPAELDQTLTRVVDKLGDK